MRRRRTLRLLLTAGSGQGIWAISMRTGYLFLTGRKKELINKGGQKISPEEIDAVLLVSPGVKMRWHFRSLMPFWERISPQWWYCPKRRSLKPTCGCTSSTGWSSSRSQRGSIWLMQSRRTRPENHCGTRVPNDTVSGSQQERIKAKNRCYTGISYEDILNNREWFSGLLKKRVFRGMWFHFVSPVFVVLRNTPLA